jgi:hypothetical protein
VLANDIVLFLVSNKNNLDKTRQSLDLFAITSMAKLNMQKSISSLLDFSKRNNLELGRTKRFQMAQKGKCYKLVRLPLWMGN